MLKKSLKLKKNTLIKCVYFHALRTCAKGNNIKVQVFILHLNNTEIKIIIFEVSITLIRKAEEKNVCICPLYIRA